MQRDDDVTATAPKPAESSSAHRWPQFRLRSLFIAMLAAGLFFGTSGFGLVGLHYPRAIENDPLVSPVRVRAVENQTLFLIDRTQTPKAEK